MASRSRGRRLIRLLRQELTPYPGRLAGSLRDTLGIVIALVAAMTLRVPGIALALALAFLMQRERPGLTLRAALVILAGAALGCAGSIVWVQVTDGNEVARFLGVVLGVFIGAFCMAATTIPLFWTIVGFYGFVNLSAWDAHRNPDAIVTSSLHNLASLAIVVLSANLVEYLFGTRHPGEELEEEMQKRLTALSQFFRALNQQNPRPGSPQFRALHHALVLYAHAGNHRLNELYDHLLDSVHDISQMPLGLHYRMGLLTRVIEKSVLLGFRQMAPEGANDQDASLAIAQLCDALKARETTPVQALPETASAPLREIYLELHHYAETSEPIRDIGPVLAESTSRSLPSFDIFLPGAFDSPDATLYALKLTLAATICYIIYNAFAWPGILTCVVTVLFTGLSSTGAMKQKQLYRFSGAAIGGILGILTVSLLFPNMDSITSLVVVVALVALLSAWVLRSPRMSYVGVQIAFGFFLTALPGFSATTQIAPARDRVIGVGLGILVMWFIFDQLWPTRTSDALDRSLRSIRRAAAELRDLRQPGFESEHEATFARLRREVSMELANVQQLDFTARFEMGRHRTRELARSRRFIQRIESSAAEFYTLARRSPRN